MLFRNRGTILHNYTTFIFPFFFKHFFLRQDPKKRFHPSLCRLEFHRPIKAFFTEHDDAHEKLALVMI